MGRAGVMHGSGCESQSIHRPLQGPAAHFMGISARTAATHSKTLPR